MVKWFIAPPKSVVSIRRDADRRVERGFFRGKKSLGDHAGEVLLRLG